MAFFNSLKEIFVAEKIRNYIIFSCVPALLFYIISLIKLSNSGLSIMQILRDPAQQYGTSSFLGFLSNMGVWLWVSSVAICFFSASIYKVSTNYRYKELLFLVGFLSLILAIDDFFLIHDRYINQNLCYLTYVVVAGTLFIRHYKIIIEINGFSFIMAGLLLASSILTDLFQDYLPLEYAYTQVFEEGFKFVGAAAWLYFTYSIASFRLREST